MKYEENIILKDGTSCLLRNAIREDAKALLENMKLIYSQTDYLTTYSDELDLSEREEYEFLEDKNQSENEVMIIAIIDGKLVASAVIRAVGYRYKIKHRAIFGVTVDKSYWSLGIGKALTLACIKCAKTANYKQIELDVVSENKTAISLYKQIGFVEYGRNPLGFNSRINGYQELIYMRLEI
ncbi:acetyltransferase, GNAT family [[Eubacterium] yurii subsp. margaretiae ATCC 43715]|nr:acetyltransferase, GNAT family [[Eubacterium] yurii subsp. margaretiae ATCC 43715]